MSDKQFEPCTLQEATHVEMGGKLYELGHDYSTELLRGRGNSPNIEVYITETRRFQLVYADAFPILGIQPMREKKREPIEFETTFAKYDGEWHPLYKLGRWIFVSEQEDNVQVC